MGALGKRYFCKCVTVVGLLDTCAELGGGGEVHDVKYGIYSCHVFEGEILVIEDHPFIAMLQRHRLYVGKHRHRHNHLTTVGQRHAELAAHIEIQALDSHVEIRYLAHCRMFLFKFLTFRLLSSESLINLLIDKIPIAINGSDDSFIFFGGELRIGDFYTFLPI